MHIGRAWPRALGLLSLLAACDRTPARESRTDSASVAGAIASAIAVAGGDAAGPITPLAPAALQSRFPNAIGDLLREADATESVNTVGIGISMAQAKYRKASQRVTMTITDIGSMSQLLAAQAPWTRMEFDRTTAGGYSRTVRIGRDKGVESESRSGGRLRTELSVVVGNRFIVNIKGTDVEMARLTAALESLQTATLPSTR